MNNITTFGNFVREKRIGTGLTLREFCRQLSYDPSNWSKIEREVLEPPHSREVLNNIARVLKLAEGSQDYKEMFDLAALSTFREDLAESDLLKQLPVFFRTVSGDKPSDEELDILISKIKSAWK